MAAEQNVLKEMAEHKRENENCLEASTSSTISHGKLRNIQLKVAFSIENI
jgi:hypothetical protein